MDHQLMMRQLSTSDEFKNDLEKKREQNISLVVYVCVCAVCWPKIDVNDPPRLRNYQVHMWQNSRHAATALVHEHSFMSLSIFPFQMCANAQHLGSEQNETKPTEVPGSRSAGTFSFFSGLAYGKRCKSLQSNHLIKLICILSSLVHIWFSPIHVQHKSRAFCSAFCFLRGA